MTEPIRLTREIHLPVRSKGREIINSFDVVIATCADPVTARLVADLVNLGQTTPEWRSRMGGE
jgi:hypothetical protein